MHDSTGDAVILSIYMYAANWSPPLTLSHRCGVRLGGEILSSNIDGAEGYRYGDPRRCGTSWPGVVPGRLSGIDGKLCGYYPEKNKMSSVCNAAYNLFFD